MSIPKCAATRSHTAAGRSAWSTQIRRPGARPAADSSIAPRCAGAAKLGSRHGRQAAAGIDRPKRSAVWRGHRAEVRANPANWPSSDANDVPPGRAEPRPTAVSGKAPRPGFPGGRCSSWCTWSTRCCSSPLPASPQAPRTRRPHYLQPVWAASNPIGVRDRESAFSGEGSAIATTPGNVPRSRDNQRRSAIARGERSCPPGQVTGSANPTRGNASSPVLTSGWAPGLGGPTRATVWVEERFRRSVRAERFRPIDRRRGARRKSNPIGVQRARSANLHQSPGKPDQETRSRSGVSGQFGLLRLRQPRKGRKPERAQCFWETNCSRLAMVGRPR